MPTTRKKIIKTVYEDDDDEERDEFKDYSDSGSEAVISGESASSEEEIDEQYSSADEFQNQTKKSQNKYYTKKPQFTKSFINRIQKQMVLGTDEDSSTVPLICVKDLTDEDKLLPPVLNLSESDSSDDDDESRNSSNRQVTNQVPSANSSDDDDESRNSSNRQVPSASKAQTLDSEGEKEAQCEYMDVWSNNLQDEGAEIAKKTFEELELHTNEIEKTKATLAQYKVSNRSKESNVKDLLAQGEEFSKTLTSRKKFKSQKAKQDSGSESEDWEEVKETKAIPQQGIQLIVDFPDAATRRSKKIDVEMMMKRKINRVKKEYQVYMHKVHVLCWLGHGNYVSRILNDQEILAAVLTFVPSETYYPGARVDLKYIEGITMWFKNKLVLKQDKHEHKFKPKAPPLKEVLKTQIKNKIVTSKKYLVFIFVSMLRALGLQCRVMFNFVTLPLKPSTSELCSLSTKPRNDKKQKCEQKCNEKSQNTSVSKSKISQNVHGKASHDNKKKIKATSSKISQLDGSDDTLVERKSLRRNKTSCDIDAEKMNKNASSPPKRARRSHKDSKEIKEEANKNINRKPVKNSISANKTRQISKPNENPSVSKSKVQNKDHVTESKISKTKTPTIKINDEDVSSTYFMNNTPDANKSICVSIQKTEDNTLKVTRTRSQTACQSSSLTSVELHDSKKRTKSAPGKSVETSKYFVEKNTVPQSVVKKTNLANKHTSDVRKRKSTQKEQDSDSDDIHRISHKDLVAKTTKKPKNDVKADLIKIIKNRVKEAKLEARKKLVKGKVNEESDDDSDYLPVEDSKARERSESDDDFKPVKIATKKTTRKLDRRVLTPDKETPKNNTDVWCEVFVEELEQWISVDVVEGKVHCCSEIYKRASHPVAYIVGWDNNNYIKDLTRRYVPHWNTVTRKLRVEPCWWNQALQPWLGPKTARDKEEDEHLDQLQLEAPLPKSIAEYKNHPLYALKRHLLKFEAIYPPDAPTLGFVRSEPVYARDCVYVCRSRDIWLKEAKVVRLGEKPYKIVKARPRWDKLSNKIVTDKLLEIFGPWQVDDYEPPVAENGIVPRNAYGNVELFKERMLPKGTVQMKLPGLNKVARKLNIDCAPAMIGFDFNGGWSHPVYDGFVVCKEFEDVLRDAWVKDQEEQEKREQEKLDARVYGNWKRLIKGLLIRERLKEKYGFEEPSTSKKSKAHSKTPRLVVKKRT